MDPATGEATVPFATSTQFFKMLVVGTVGGFADLVTFSHHAEAYTLKAGATLLAHLGSLVELPRLHVRVYQPNSVK